MEQEYPVISLFSGALGLDLGLEVAGLSVRIAQDIDPWCVRTAGANGQTRAPVIERLWTFITHYLFPKNVNIIIWGYYGNTV